MSLLILVRHGESEWNVSQKITGWADVALAETGKKQAQQIGQKLKDIAIDIAYTSELCRAIETLSNIQDQRQNPLPFKKHAALNERNFGTFTGRIKSDLIREIGMDVYAAVFQAWDIRAPEGESLKTVYKRVISYFDNQVLKDLQKGQNVLIVGHHHALRTLVKYLEAMSDNEITALRLHNADAIVYDFDPDNNAFIRRSLL